ncbi:MAG: MerC domain-containing protein [Pseudomonadota bacterium]
MSDPDQPHGQVAQPTDPSPIAQHGASIDWYGLSIAMLCLVHCLALPALLVAVPTLLATLGNEQVHQFLALLTLPAVAALLYEDLGQRGYRWAAIIAGLGAISILSAVFVPSLEAWEEPLTVAGSIALAGAHGHRLWRRRHRSEVASSIG